MTKRMLELYSGTGSVGKVAKEMGYDVISVDISKQFHTPTHLVDVLTWDYKIYPKGHFDVIWASPPCATFSVINNALYPKDQQLERIRRLGLPLLRKGEEIIDYFEPKWYFIENPKGQMANYIDNRPKYELDYCRYSDWGYRKRTNIWTNKPNLSFLLCGKSCENMTEDKKHHRIQVLGRNSKRSAYSKKEIYRIPSKLVEYLLHE